MKTVANSKKKEKIFLALSGGVDSSVSALLLKNQGYDVTGVFMKNWSGDDYGIQKDCPWEKDQADAMDVCKKLDIPFMTFNFEKIYRTTVMDYFFDEIKAGRTPNPDVMCNKEIKFGVFFSNALEKGADLIATGHYARIKKIDEHYFLRKAKDQNKDQSYFLCNVTEKILEKTLFPVGNLLKTEVRQIAKANNLPVANKPDSQGICFIGEINVGEFLRANIKVHKGEIVDIDTNEVVGMHDGIEFYTIGQREGLKIGGLSDPYYVVKKDKSNNVLFVAKGSDNKELFSSRVHFENAHWINEEAEIEKIGSENLEASIRYRQKPAGGKLDLKGNIFEFDKPQRAVAEGQNIVFYSKDICFGGAIITN